MSGFHSFRVKIFHPTKIKIYIQIFKSDFKYLRVDIIVK